jgi:hypothetical protein
MTRGKDGGKNCDHRGPARIKDSQAQPRFPLGASAATRTVGSDLCVSGTVRARVSGFGCNPFIPYRDGSNCVFRLGARLDLQAER